MANINPLDMPEIRNLVRRFLTRTDLVCCLRVCKAWRSSYLPFVWSIASIQQEGPNPTIESLNHYREFVKGLSYDVVVGSECMSIEFPILKRLEVYNKPGTQVWKFPCGLNNLKELRVAGLELTTENAATTFWSLCTQLELLHAENMIVAHLPEKSVSFDRLVNLSLSFYTRIPRTHQAEWMEWINQCRNIVFLDLCYPCTLQSAIDAFVMRFAAGTWSKVQELALRLFKLSDEDLARVIGGMHKATVLDIRYSPKVPGHLEERDPNKLYGRRDHGLMSSVGKSFG
ncbi:hypothetical protein BGX31_008298 [Mortierella sp. GBA43]|nr:hypothetical protein BGX31_008298 [Mortierella sp. GBA43]